jgi:hypothetical protein
MDLRGNSSTPCFKQFCLDLINMWLGVCFFSFSNHLKLKGTVLTKVN